MKIPRWADSSVRPYTLRNPILVAKIIKHDRNSPHGLAGQESHQKLPPDAKLRPSARRPLYTAGLKKTENWSVVPNVLCYDGSYRPQCHNVQVARSIDEKDIG